MAFFSLATRAAPASSVDSGLDGHRSVNVCEDSVDQMKWFMADVAKMFFDYIITLKPSNVPVTISSTGELNDAITVDLHVPSTAFLSHVILYTHLVWIHFDKYLSIVQ